MIAGAETAEGMPFMSCHPSLISSCLLSFLLRGQIVEEEEEKGNLISFETALPAVRCYCTRTVEYSARTGIQYVRNTRLAVHTTLTVCTSVLHVVH